MTFENYPDGDRLTAEEEKKAESLWQAARIAELEAENKRLQNNMRNLTSLIYSKESLTNITRFARELEEQPHD